MYALGIDVGLKKGLDLVLLDQSRHVLKLAHRLPHDRLRETVLAWAPAVVAIDSPPRWASEHVMRETERQVRRLGIQLYATPAESRRSLKGFHDWMLAGIEAFGALEPEYPLFDGSPLSSRSAFEVFPHGSAVVLSGCLPPAGTPKHAWRRAVLASQGIDHTELVTPDLVDAALAALTGIYALEGRACWMGLPSEGMIVLPSFARELPARYLRTPA